MRNCGHCDLVVSDAHIQNFPFILSDMCHMFVTILKKCRNQFVKIRHFISGTCPEGFDKNTWLMPTVQDMEIYIELLPRIYIRASLIHKKGYTAETN